MNKRKFFVSIFIVFGIFAAAYFLSTENTASVIQSTKKLTVNPPADWQVYENTRYGFSIFVPKELVIKEFDESGGASTITFQNVEKGLGFQIFAVPHKEDKVNERRFLQDVSSGVRKNVEKTFIGKSDVEAVTFNSHDPFLGETREVWFIHNDYLFEVTTFREIGDWFTLIIQTWRFTVDN